MTAISTIIQSAYRELNLIALGASPTTAQSTEALTLVNRVYAHVLGSDAGELLQNWPLGNYGRQSIDQIDWTALRLTNPPPNVKLIATALAATTVYLPARPLDGARIGIIDPFSRLATYPVTLNGNGSTVEGAATVTLSTNAMDRTWLYRADTANWVRLTDLVEATESPFPSEYDDYFAILLALRIAPRAGRKLADATVTAYKSLDKKFQARYIQQAPLQLDSSLNWMSQQSWPTYWPWPYGSTAAFNQGWGSGWW